jgi:hypothetical protein
LFNFPEPEATYPSEEDEFAFHVFVSVGVYHVPSALKNLACAPAAGAGTKPKVPAVEAVAPVNAVLFITDVQSKFP